MIFLFFLLNFLGLNFYSFIKNKNFTIPMSKLICTLIPKTVLPILKELTVTIFLFKHDSTIPLEFLVTDVTPLADITWVFFFELIVAKALTPDKISRALILSLNFGPSFSWLPISLEVSDWSVVCYIPSPISMIAFPYSKELLPIVHIIVIYRLS